MKAIGSLSSERPSPDHRSVCATRGSSANLRRSMVPRLDSMQSTGLRRRERDPQASVRIAVAERLPQCREGWFAGAVARRDEIHLVVVAQSNHDFLDRCVGRQNPYRINNHNIGKKSRYALTNLPQGVRASF